ncbi:MAG TPA: glycoside hydrolase family 2 protein [Verrucomicrobiae bacterium]|jgi:beta-mannosidase
MNKITKRQFLVRTTMAAGALCAWQPLVSICKAAAPSTPRRLSLNGAWQVSGQNIDWIPATVPGCVHTDLLAAGKIPDPFLRDNENGVQWVGQSDWTYKRNFDVPNDVLKNDRVLLRCEGLDTLATIKINGQPVGEVDNMFRTWEFDVKSLLQAGDNEIEILFRSPFPVMKDKDTQRPLYEWIGSHEPKGRAWVRKEPCSFGWDWGPVLPSAGIWKNISLETFNTGRLSDVLILQNHADKKVTLDVRVNAEITGNGAKPCRAVATVFEVSAPGKTIASATFDISGGSGHGELQIDHPKIWWPAGMGEQPLYTVHVDLLDPDGAPIDSTSKRIGLRELKMVLPQGDSPLHFEANGIAYFAKGGNWIPCDSFNNRVTPEILRRYIADAKAVNMNSLRFWGGGFYEDDALFDACDEAGICVWLDFKFACSAYPAFEDSFMDSVRLEARDNLQRLRHHPCIAVWCGNNEISLMTKDEWSDQSMGRADYDKLFKDMIAKQVTTFAPQANYVSGSPDCGDTHYWQVWHGPKTFDAYRTLTGFMSEFGYQSFPEPKTVRAFTSEEDRSSVLSAVMKWHQRSGTGDVDGNTQMLQMMDHYFKTPKDFDMTLWLSQILQGFGIKIGAEYWRQTMPKSMGCVFWQYNDIWPGMSWSSVDYFGRWKALHYMARKFYSPILVSALENIPGQTADIFVTSDLGENAHGKLTWEVTDLDGNSLARDFMHVKIQSRKSEKVKTLDLKEQVHTNGANGILTWLKLEVRDQVVSENLVMLALPKELRLSDPGLTADVIESDDGLAVTLRSKKPALWTWLELEGVDAKFSDNFMHVTPGMPRTIMVKPATGLSVDDVRGRLSVRSLFDTSNA